MYIGAHWVIAYLVFSSRLAKQIAGIDHQSAPREDLAKYGDQAVREGRITQKRLDMIQRMEAATANSIDGYSLFVGSGMFW